MDKIGLLKERKKALRKASEEIRARIAELTDEDSFVELSAFCFSKGDAYGEERADDGVVTGFATVDGYPFYLVAQNFASDLGGLTKGNCEKIARTLSAAEKNGTPVVWLLHCGGAKADEGIDVLEGISELLLRATRLKGVVPQYAVVGGEVYGAAAAIAAVADVVFFLKEGALALTSPLVLSAKAGKDLKKEEVGGYAALRHTGLPALAVKDMEEVSVYLKEFTELLGLPVIDAELNEETVLSGKSAEDVLSLLEGGIEIGANGYPAVRTALGRMGGIALAAVVLDGRLDAGSVGKLRRFAEFSRCYGLPLVAFVNCAGIEESLAVNDSGVLNEITEYLALLDATDTAKIAVVTGSASGLGYSLFAAKSAGFDYTYALATAEISLFERERGAEILYGGKEHAERYAEEHGDPVNAAKRGYLDNVIEPQFLKQYLIASLQTLLR